MIYLDYSATTPVNEDVLNTYMEVTKKYMANPNSLHKLGVEAKRIIDAATSQIADILKVKPQEVIYTSGASEANNFAIKGICEKYKNRGKHIITTELEHSSIIAPLSFLQRNGYDIDFVKLDENGLVDLKDLESKIRDDTILVTIASVNSEVGIVQPMEEIARIIRKYPKVIFHSDITQSIGKMKIDLSLFDLATFSAQKFYGPKGVGCLIKKEKISIEPLIHGGKSTTIYRSGTPATPLIVSMSKALRLAYKDLDNKIDMVKKLNKELINKLNEFNIDINSNKYCLPHIVNISLKNIKSETMLHALEESDIFVSTQTACSTGNYSKSVYALTNDSLRSSMTIRISLSHLTTMDEIDKFIKVFKEKLDVLGRLKNESN